MQNIVENLSLVHEQITQACRNCQRDRSEVQLLCVSKTKPIEMIKAAYEAGERHFGESYALEAVDKIAQLKEAGFNDIVWHFIGPIQSNKTKYIAASFDVVESVERAKILERLNAQRPDEAGVLQILLQVNISHEEQKQGCEEEELPQLLALAASLPKLKVIGLMGVARIDATPEELKASFTRLQYLLKHYQVQYPNLKVLSMGMTHDLTEAIACGSTEVRIGTAIFGERQYHTHA